MFIHVSTAYANCDRMHISEVVYNSPVQPEKIIEAVDWIEEDLVKLLTPKVIQLRPNTYTYTKAIAETLVFQECKDFIPCAIIRPSIGKQRSSRLTFYFIFILLNLNFSLK